MPSGFTQVFGGNNIYPVGPTYSQLNYAANIQLSWPVEQAIAGALVVTDIMDLNPSNPGLTVTLPDARQVSTGYTALFNNISANTAAVNSNTGTTLVSLVSGTVWQLYLIDNSTAGGTWRIFQFGASVSVAVAAALAGSGLTAIGSTLNEQIVIQPKSVSYVSVNTDRATCLQWTAGVGTFTLPAPGTVGAAWFVIIKNQGSGNLTVSPTSGLIDGNASATLAPGASAWYLTDGSNFFSLTGGQTAGGGNFNLLQIDVSGSGNFVLSGGQLNQIGYRFTGVLTGARHIQVPNTTQEYWVDNETTGAFTLDVGTVGQISPIVVPQTNRNILYCDGSNVVNALTNSVAFPITIGQGGTGATSAGVALTNLGGTSVGVNVFTAVSGAAACAAIGAVTTTTLAATNVTAGTGLTGGGSLAGSVTLNVDETVIQVINPAQNVQNSNYNFALTDNGNEVFRSSSTPAYTILPQGGGAGHVAWVTNNNILIVSGSGAGSLTVVPGAGVTLTQSGTGATGTRTLAPNGVMMIFMRAANDWVCWGLGIS